MVASAQAMLRSTTFWNSGSKTFQSRAARAFIHASREMAVWLARAATRSSGTLTAISRSLLSRYRFRDRTSSEASTSASDSLTRRASSSLVSIRCLSRLRRPSWSALRARPWGGMCVSRSQSSSLEVESINTISRYFPISLE